MSNKMLIDGTHAEETRVVVVRNKTVEDFDFEAASKRPLRGNIYLAKVIRVEPSLQAAFVDYGGNRHGFLAFSEIHPDYYQIPQADRAALLEAEAAEYEEKEREPKPSRSRSSRSKSSRTKSAKSAAPAASSADEQPPYHSEFPQETEGFVDDAKAADAQTHDEAGATEVVNIEIGTERPQEADADGAPEVPVESEAAAQATDEQEDAPAAATTPAEEPSAAVASESDADTQSSEAASDAVAAEPVADAEAAPAGSEPATEMETAAAAAKDAPVAAAEAEAEGDAPAEEPKPKPRRRRKTQKSDDGLAAATLTEDDAAEASTDSDDDGDAASDDEDDAEPETIGNDDAMDVVAERPRREPRRHYKIQDVIKRRQIIVVQVVKEERGTKGAALTTYLSLAGRYCVLMPNTDRGGGVSRKITDNSDRRRLKELVSELEVPERMGVILRTAGAARTKTEIKRDFEYLLRAWDNVRDSALASIAPQLVYEEGNLVKRSIRDLYNKEIDEVLVSGDTAYREAKDFMKMLMPSHAKNVKVYREPTPIFTAYAIENQLDAMFSPQVTLPSKGYLVINPTEALVAIDVNSGRSTKESNIEDTALKTNLEAADEVARQLRLRDLAGLIVIDFIDMEDKRHNRQVEKRLKDALKLDRSRIQVGRISSFGLLEMSRQRMRQGMVETSMIPCPHCAGTGMIRSTPSVALFCLRSLEEYLLKASDHHVTLRTSSAVALYILNQKRTHLNELEERFQLNIGVDADETLSNQHMEIVRSGLVDRDPDSDLPTTQLSPDAVTDDEPEEVDAAAERGSDERSPRKRRRRKRRGGGAGSSEALENGASGESETPSDPQAVQAADGQPEGAEATEASATDDADGDDKGRNRRRRGRRGGRRHRREDDVTANADADAEEQTASDGTVASVNGAAPEPEAEAPPQVGEASAEGAQDEVPAASPEPSTDDDQSSPTDSNGIEVAVQDEDTAPEIETAPADASESVATETETVNGPDDAVSDEALADQPVPASLQNGDDGKTAPAEANTAGAEKVPSEDEGKRPRRVGWWQRRSFF